MTAKEQILYDNYIDERDGILKQTHSANMTDYLDAIRPLWFAYQAKLKALSGPTARAA
jgi:hypothetical protein